MYKRIFDGKKAVIFDLDGTVLNSQAHWHEAIRRTLETFDAVSELRIPGGLRLEDIWNHFIDNYEIDAKVTVKELVNNTNREFFKLIEENPIEVTEGFWAFAAELKVDKGLKLGLTTNSNREITTKLLDILGFQDTFDYTLCGDEVKNPKPDPEIYLKAIKELGFSKKEYLVFEDSLPGVTAAVKAGLDTIVIWDGTNYQNEYPQDVLGFVTNFNPFPGNFDTTLEEMIKIEAQAAIDNEKSS